MLEQRQLFKPRWSGAVEGRGGVVDRRIGVMSYKCMVERSGGGQGAEKGLNGIYADVNIILSRLRFRSDQKI